MNIGEKYTYDPLLLKTNDPDEPTASVLEAMDSDFEPHGSPSVAFAIGDGESGVIYIHAMVKTRIHGDDDE